MGRPNAKSLENRMLAYRNPDRKKSKALHHRTISVCVHRTVAPVPEDNIPDSWQGAALPARAHPKKKNKKGREARRLLHACCLLYTCAAHLKGCCTPSICCA
jgi:hypothetical protein